VTPSSLSSESPGEAHGSGCVSQGYGAGDLPSDPARQSPPFSGLVARKAKSSCRLPSWSHRPTNPVPGHFRAEGTPAQGRVWPSSILRPLFAVLTPTEAPSPSPQQQQWGKRMAIVPSAQRKKCPSVVSCSPLIGERRPHVAGATPPSREAYPCSALLTPGLLVWRLLEGGSPRGSL